MPICKSCGSNNDAENSFCSECGEKLGAPRLELNLDSPVVSNQSSAAPDPWANLKLDSALSLGSGSEPAKDFGLGSGLKPENSLERLEISPKNVEAIPSNTPALEIGVGAQTGAVKAEAEPLEDWVAKAANIPGLQRVESLQEEAPAPESIGSWKPKQPVAPQSEPQVDAWKPSGNETNSLNSPGLPKSAPADWPSVEGPSVLSNGNSNDLSGSEASWPPAMGTPERSQLQTQINSELLKEPKIENGKVNITNYLFLSICTTLCCCFPGGVAAIVLSVMANGKADKGLKEDAERLSQYALYVNIASIVLGFGIVLLVFLISFVAGNS